MLRNLVLSSVAGLALMTPLAVAPAAQAKAPEQAHHERDRDRHHDRDHDHWRDHEYWRQRFEVMYRPCCDRPWVFYSSCDGRGEADRIADNLRAQGYEVLVRD